jgi:UDP-2,3-diacylglucosamine pyrophosphatase LpxH
MGVTVGEPSAQRGALAGVPVLTPEDELERLQSLVKSPPREILIVSDLHLGCGRDPATGRIARAENFFADEEFAALLRFYADVTRSGQLLVLNGDVFDFLRITDSPRGEDEMRSWSEALALLGVERSPELLGSSILPVERQFGLRTNDFKSVWKLQRIVRGHATFFAALAGWVAGGGMLLFVKGNHDLELHWPLVRQSLRAELVRRGVAINAADRNILFCETWVRLANVYLEHGHRFEQATRVDGPPTLDRKPEELNLPLGSFVNRYLINPIEHIEPFIDNVKPVNALLLTVVRQHPLQVFGILWRSWRFLLRAAESRQWRQGLAYTLFFGALAVPLLTVLVIALVLILPAAGAAVARLFGRASWVFGALGLFLPYVLGALHEVFPRRTPKVGEDDFACGVYHALEECKAGSAPGTQYGVVGHTHVQDVQSLPPLGAAPVLYLNTGTWTPLWQADRPDLAGRILHPFVRFTLTGSGVYQHEYCEWDADAGRPVPSIILEPVAARVLRGRKRR